MMVLLQVSFIKYTTCFCLFFSIKWTPYYSQKCIYIASFIKKRNVVDKQPYEVLFLLHIQTDIKKTTIAKEKLSR